MFNGRIPGSGPDATRPGVVEDRDADRDAGNRDGERDDGNRSEGNRAEGDPAREDRPGKHRQIRLR
ncbi:hypothetical protein GCM10017559_26020 [Streptosporangium longisporum]|uniref:Uncharacterized protein n=1 Tax=Streptosporangium longisporum TaxID=46187 RepID=A0ABN3XXC7_9ACTN